MGAICRSWDKQQAKDREKKKEGNEREAKIKNKAVRTGMETGSGVQCVRAQGKV